MKIYSQQISNFHALREGGEASISRAWDMIGQHEVVFTPCAGGTPEQRKRAETIIRLSRQLGDSGFLAAEDVLLEGEEIAGYTFPLIETGDLKETADNLDDPVLLSVLKTVCQSLAHLHSLDYLHCDIKPDNILIERTGEGVRPFVIDLGLAARRGEQNVTTIKGTVPFIAPEHLAGKALTETADIYSFGKVLEFLGQGIRTRELRQSVHRLSQECCTADPSERPQSFLDVHDALRRLQTGVFGSSDDIILSPPLRDTGVRLRVNSLRQRIADPEGQWCGVCLVTGDAGVGKSKILREFALERQLAGDETVRFVGVESLAELADFVNSRVTRPQRRGVRTRALWIAAETSRGCALSSDALLRLHSAVCGRQAVLLLEYRGALNDLPSSDIRSVRIKPFGLRECIVASSHLQDDPSVSPINGQALLIASAGNPSLLRECLKIRLTSPRTDRSAEPVNFDRLSSPIVDYWRRQFETLTPPLRAVLEDASVFHADFDPVWIAGCSSTDSDVARSLEGLMAAGWLTRNHGQVASGRLQYVCRTARNFVRQQLGDNELTARAEHLLTWVPQLQGSGAPSSATIWELHRIAGCINSAPSAQTLWQDRRGLDDTKLAALALLKEYRASRRSRGARALSLATGISNAFSELGSVRRRKRWAAAAFGNMQMPVRGRDLTIGDALLLCHLFELSGELESKRRALTTVLNEDEFVDAHVKGYLLSELGTLQLYRSEWNQAKDLYLQAHHLLERAAPTSAEYVRNLNRVGLSLMRTGHYPAARKRLELCRALAEKLGFDHIARPSLGNLAILEHDLGDPQAAMQNSRRVLQSYRSARDASGYLRALPDRVICLVDLGQGYLALRAAQLSVWLANLHSMRVELRHALNNLGWILMMQGEAGRAYQQLQAAVQGYAQWGDTISTVRAQLNLAWTFLLAGELERAEEYCLSGLDHTEAREDLHGHCEAYRILAQTAIMKEDYRMAEDHLSNVPREDPRLSPRDRTETSLAWLNLRLWQADIIEAERLGDELAANPIVENVHPMACDFGRMRGMLYTLRGDYDRALEILSATSSVCRGGGRIDKLIDTMIALIFLAQRMHNWAVGERYLQTVTKITDTMKRQLAP